jgi:hypothetical protein
MFVAGRISLLMSVIKTSLEQDVAVLSFKTVEFLGFRKI